MASPGVGQRKAPICQYAARRLYAPLSFHTDQKVTMAETIKRLPVLPVERAFKVVGGRWKAVILYHLFDGPRRLSQLKRALPEISQKVLIQQLREMEEHGLVHREIFRQVPPRVGLFGHARWA